MYWHILVATTLSDVVASARLYRRDTTYTTSLRDPTFAQSFGTAGQLTTVNSGVTRWLSGSGPHNFFGNLNNNGTIVVSQTDQLKLIPATIGDVSDYTISTGLADANLNNYGTISLNDYGATTGATYAWTLNTMVNAGNMQWCGLGTLLGSSYTLTCGSTCYNQGVLDFEQYNDNAGTAFTWSNTILNGIVTAGANIYNNGAFRLVNVDFQAVQNVLGTGCWVLGLGSTLYMQNGAGTLQNQGYGPTFPNQTIYFSDSSAVLHMDPQVYSYNPAFGPQLYGFGSGNAIEFGEALAVTVIGKPYSYSTTTGILTVNFALGNTVNIKLGKGYTASLFSSGLHTSKYNLVGFNAIFYSGTAPSQTTPTVCSVSLGPCVNPTSTVALAASSTTSSTTPVTTSTTTSTQTTTTKAATTTSTTTTSVTTSSSTTTSATTTSATTTRATTSTTPTTTLATTTSASTTAATYVTTTLAYTGAQTLTGPITMTIATASGASAGTVAVYTAAGTYVTSTQLYTGTVVSTGTVATATGTTPGTVIVYTPAVYVTTTLAYTGAQTLTGPITSTIATASGANAGTVAVYTAAGTYVTLTQAYTGSAATTNTLATATGTTPGTVIVYIPASYVTMTQAYTGTVASTSIVAQATGTSAGIVVVYTPASYVTTTLAYTGTSALTGTLTTTIVPASGTSAGTVAVFIAAATYTTTTLAYTGSQTLTGPITATIVTASGTTPGTVAVYTAAGTTYATATMPYTGTSVLTAPLTSTIAIQVGTTPGIVAVYTPTTTTAAVASTSATTSRPAILSTTTGPDMCVCIPQ